MVAAEQPGSETVAPRFSESEPRNDPDGRGGPDFRGVAVLQRRRFVSLLLSLVLVAAVLHARKPDAFENPQFWAEDGTVFFQQSYDLGLEAFFESYAGYFHTVPRMVAGLASALPYSFTPAVYNYSSLLLLLVVACYLHSPLLALRWPAAYALATVLVPHRQGEIFLNLTNAQWVLALLLFLIAVKPPAATRVGRIAEWAIVLAAGLSGPFIVVLLPLYCVQLVRFRSAASLTSLLLAGVASAVQILEFRSLPIVMPPSGGHSDAAWLDLVGQKLFGNLVLGDKLPYTLPPLGLIVAASAVIALLAWRLGRLPQKRDLAFAGFFFSAAVLALVFYKFRGAADLLVPAAAASRYFYVPYVLFSWACLTLLLHSARWPDRAFAILLLALVLRSSLISGFQSAPLEDLAWQEHAARIGTEGDVTIPIHPKGWEIHLQER